MKVLRRMMGFDTLDEVYVSMKNLFDSKHRHIWIYRKSSSAVKEILLFRCLLL